jgi:hypothetical protein
MALDLEEQQYTLVNLDLFSLMELTQIFRRQLQLEASKMEGMATSKQLADLEEKHTTLRNQIQHWHQAQLAYTPCVASLMQTLVANPDAAESLPVESAESMPLHLPSSLP